MTTALSDAGVQFADGNTQAYAQVPVRQTVLSGPVDTNGFSAFGGSTGSTTVTATGTLVVAAANSVSNRVGSKVNPSWTGLSTNGTMYLYVDVNTDGTVTEGSGTLSPIYQWGGTPAITSGLFTFNIQQMIGYIGNGSAAVAGYRTYLGEVTVASGVVSAIVWYSLMGRSSSALFGLATSSVYSISHNLGVRPKDARLFLVCVTADNGYVTGDETPMARFGISNASTSSGMDITTVKTLTIGVVSGINQEQLRNPSTGTFANITMANWKLRAEVNRGMW